MSRNVNVRNTLATYEALTPQQAVAIAGLLSGKSGREAATEAGCTEETLSRWRNGAPAFVAALNLARAELFDVQMDAIRALRRKALDTLAGLLDSDDDATRLKAAALALRVDMSPPSGALTPEKVSLQWQNTRSVNMLETLAATEYATLGTVVYPYAETE